MKFMKRTKDKVTKELDDAEGRAMYASQITDAMLRHGECPFIVESSYVPVEGLVDGRFSFRGMNPEIERLLELEQQAKDALRGHDVKKDVEDEEMADHYYGSVTNTMARAFNRKQLNNNRDQQQPYNNYHNGGNRRKMLLPPAAMNGSGNNNGGATPKRARFLKPAED